jgi:hypothetical protein
MRKSDFVSIVQRFLDGVLSTDDLENWANAIESRDDIGFENNELSEFIFDLANPVINGEITKELVIKMID